MTHEPTDDEVERACAAGHYGTGHEIMRVMLRVAMNPPTPKPIAGDEIEVTRATVNAGASDWQKE